MAINDINRALIGSAKMGSMFLQSQLQESQVTFACFMFLKLSPFRKGLYWSLSFLMRLTRLPDTNKNKKILQTGFPKGYAAGGDDHAF